MSLLLSGIGVSRGIAIGPVRVLHEIQPKVTQRSVAPRQRAAEIERFRSALHDTITDLRGVQARLKQNVPKELMHFLDTHLLMLEDEALSLPVIDLIREHAYTSEWALATHRDSMVQLFDQIDDPYLRMRGEDVENVITKVLQRLGGAAPPARPAGGAARQGYIVVTNRLTPSDVIVHHHDGMRGLVCGHGGTMSHTAIVARSLQVPAVTAVQHGLHLLAEGDELIIDGASGMVVAEPDRRATRHYRGRQREQRERRRRLDALRDTPAVTRDGEAVHLWANVDTGADAGLARRVGAEGIGLFRTESLYLDREDLPSEREQLAVYRRMLRAMQGRPVTIRTLDIWAGQRLRGVVQRFSCEQPAMGLRAIRLCLKQPELFRPQLRAVLRASAYGPLRLLLPMITSVAELRSVLAMIEQTREELTAEGRAFDANLPVGLLVEVPATAVACRLFAPHVDFLSIGSNDLTQYTLAVDRADDTVEDLYDPLHPAVLSLIRNVVQVGRRAHKPVMLCGEMAADWRITPLLLGLGLRELSVHPATLAEVKDAILHTRAEGLSRLARRAMSSDSPERTARILKTAL